MFEEIPFIFGFMIFSLIISYTLIKWTSPPLTNIFQGLSAIGIVFHELCHLIMCVISRVPIEKVTLIKKDWFEIEKKVGYYGEVKVQETRISFMQAILVGLAPLYLSFWLFFFLLNLLVYTKVNIWIFLFSIVVMISISLSAAPSFSDLTVIYRAIQNDPRNSFYQFIIVVFSFLTCWGIIEVFNLYFIHELFFYLLIATFYFLFKYGFKMIGYIIYSRNNYYRPKNRKRLVRRRFKPITHY